MLLEPSETVTVGVTVNGRHHRLRVAARLTVADVLRDELELTGTHLGCEQGVCGACTVLLDGVAVRSCLLYAGQLDGVEVVTVEGLADGGRLGPVQEAFAAAHALQCGFCTPGFLITATELVSRGEPLDDDAIRDELSGNLCRCTGYDSIVAAVASLLRNGDPA